MKYLINRVNYKTQELTFGVVKDDEIEFHPFCKLLDYEVIGLNIEEAGEMLVILNSEDAPFVYGLTRIE